MKQLLLFITALWTVSLCHAQVPQFSPTEFDGWYYNNPNVTLEEYTILNNKVALYVTTNGLVLSLTSPQFTCHQGEIIDLEVTWITPQWQNEGFKVEWVALTAALLNEQGQTVDSVTCVPVNVSRTNILNMSLAAPCTLQHARLKFAAWKSIVSNCGIINEVKTTSGNRADVNHDGEVNIADVNIIINAILKGQLSLDLDINGDGEVNIADVNQVIAVIQS